MRRPFLIGVISPVLAALAVLLASCSGSSRSTTSASPTGPSTSTAGGATTTRSSPPSSTAVSINADTRITVGKIDVPVPLGWMVVTGTDHSTINGEKVLGADSACLAAPGTNKDGIPFECTGVLILTATAFEHANEGSKPYSPDNPFQWYPGTDVPACAPDFPYVKSRIVEAGLVPIGGKKAAFRRLEVRCEKRPSVHEVVSWTLPQSRVTVVSVFHPAEARAIWAASRLTA